ncbi:MAG: hypothetical protein GC145_14180 [Caulobacter sp.]|nr:hypothetical protein [Caulobacter sp.]
MRTSTVSAGVQDGLPNIRLPGEGRGPESAAKPGNQSQEFDETSWIPAFAGKAEIFGAAAPPPFFIRLSSAPSEAHVDARKPDFKL